MIDWRAAAVCSLLGLLLAGYMVRSNHARYVADLCGVCAAVFSQRPQLAIIACAIAAVVRHSGLFAGALAMGLPDWLGRVLLPGAYDMSSNRGKWVPALESTEPPSDPNQGVENTEIPQPVAEKPDENFYFGEIAALARLVAAGAIGLTEATKIGGQAKSGKKYQKRSDDIKAEVKRLANRYPNQTEEQREQRAALKM